MGRNFEHIGNKMTYKIISDQSGEEICRSAIRTTRDNTDEEPTRRSCQGRHGPIQC